MVDDGELSVGLFYFELGGCRLDAENIVVSRINHHRDGSNSAQYAMRYTGVSSVEGSSFDCCRQKKKKNKRTLFSENKEEELRRAMERSSRVLGAMAPRGQMRVAKDQADCMLKDRQCPSQKLRMYGVRSIILGLAGRQTPGCTALRQSRGRNAWWGFGGVPGCFAELGSLPYQAFSVSVKLPCKAMLL